MKRQNTSRVRYAALITILLLIMGSLSACGAGDEINAFAVISDSNGNCVTISAACGVDDIQKNACWVISKDQVKASASFYCTKCEYEETVEIDTQEFYLHMFKCECTGENNYIGKTQYFCVIAITGEEDFLGVREDGEFPTEVKIDT